MQLEKLEIESLIEEILLRYGYDFTGYARASFYRRIDRFMTNSVIKDGEALKKYIFTNPKNFEFFVQELTVNVTEMFRDPSYFLELRKKVIPMLSTYPHIKIWDAGCSTGEELFSLAILLKEENLLERTKIYATDLNQKVLLQAKEGIFPMISIPSYTQNYHKAGGKADFSDYYTANYGNAKFNSSLIRNVIFYPHNLATDSSFNEFHLIICRNVMIYFDRTLQERVFGIFSDSLATLGYLCIGKKETLYVSSYNSKFELVDKDEKIYRKIEN